MTYDAYIRYLNIFKFNETLLTGKGKFISDMHNLKNDFKDGNFYYITELNFLLLPKTNEYYDILKQYNIVFPNYRGSSCFKNLFMCTYISSYNLYFALISPIFDVDLSHKNSIVANYNYVLLTDIVFIIPVCILNFKNYYTLTFSISGEEYHELILNLSKNYNIDLKSCFNELYSKIKRDLINEEICTKEFETSI